MTWNGDCKVDGCEREAVNSSGFCSNHQMTTPNCCEQWTAGPDGCGRWGVYRGDEKLKGWSGQGKCFVSGLSELSARLIVTTHELDISASRSCQSGPIADLTRDKERLNHLLDMLEYDDAGCPVGWPSKEVVAARSNPQPQPWHPTATQPPAAQDADCDGQIWAMHVGHQLAQLWNWSVVASNQLQLTHWQRTGLRRPQPPKEGE